MKPSDLKLIWDRVLIKPDTPEEKTAGGLYIPDQAKEKPETGTVVATGKGRIDKKTGRMNPMQTKTGDKILYNQNDGEVVMLENQKYLMINDFEVLAVIG